MQPKEPKKWDYKVTLDSGRIVYTRSPTWGDVESVSSLVKNEKGETNEIAFLREMFTNVILALQRNNGEFVDLTNRNELFSKILTFDEAAQIAFNGEELGLVIKKNPPKVEMWRNRDS